MYKYIFMAYFLMYTIVKVSLMSRKVLFSLFSFFMLGFGYAQSFSWQTSITNGSRINNASSMYSPLDYTVVGGNPFNDSITSIFYTTDAAVNWNMLFDVPNTPMLWDICNVNEISYACGDAGLIMKSTDNGHTWSNLTLTGNVSSRSYKAIHFINTTKGFAVGGNLSNDSIYTLIKTTNGGNSWSVVFDNLGEMFNDIYFLDENNGYIVGNKGTFYKTTDGGDNWTQISISGSAGNRTFNAVKFTDVNNGVIVGGNRSNDSIQTILKTTDGGQNWSVIRDNIAPILNDVDFYDSMNGYAVGRDGTVLYTNDGGNTWSNVTIAGTNSFWMFTHVNLINASNGLICARQGGFVYAYDVNNTNNFYVPPSIIVNTLNAAIVGANALQINGELNVDNIPYNTFFQYGVDSANMNSISIPHVYSFSDNQTHAISDTIFNLTLNSFYYYRLAVENGTDTIYGNIRKTFFGQPSIPNFDFELWDTTSMLKLNDWLTMGEITQVPSSIDGNYAVQISSNVNMNDGNIGVIFHGIPGDSGFQGGVPFTVRPDSVVGYFKYDIAAGDSALVLLMTKNGGSFLSQDINYIYGSSGGSFERLSFPINYMATGTPDSIIIGVTNTNAFGTPNLSSVNTVDNIFFINASGVNVPNASFENWYSDTSIKPKFWQLIDDRVGFPANAQQTTDAQHKNFAITVENILQNSDTLLGIISTENNGNVWDYYNQPSFALNHKPEKLFGYYKFNPQNNDTLQVSIVLFQNGTDVGSGWLQINQSTSTYQLFTADINYYNPSAIPDSASIGIQAFSFQPRGNSKAWIDNLNFDVLILGEDTLNEDTTSIISQIPEIETINFYPNPTNGQITIEFENNTETNCQISLYDLSGKIVSDLYNNRINTGTFYNNFDVSQINNGIYLLNIATSNGYQTQLLQIKH